MLIIDDDFAVRDSLAAVIESYGFRASTAANGIEGLQALDIEIPAAIITDLHMPDMDGFELLSTLIVGQAGIPVIAISGGAFRGYDLLTAAKHMGAAATFQKPLPVPAVIDAIASLTGGPAV